MGAEETGPARDKNSFCLLHSFRNALSRGLSGLDLDTRLFALIEEETIDFLHDPA